MDIYRARGITLRPVLYRRNYVRTQKRAPSGFDLQFSGYLAFFVAFLFTEQKKRQNYGIIPSSKHKGEWK